MDPKLSPGLCIATKYSIVDKLVFFGHGRGINILGHGRVINILGHGRAMNIFGCERAINTFGYWKAIIILWNIFTWGQLGLLAIWATYTLVNLSFG